MNSSGETKVDTQFRRETYLAPRCLPPWDASIFSHHVLWEGEQKKVKWGNKSEWEYSMRGRVRIAGVSIKIIAS